VVSETQLLKQLDGNVVMPDPILMDASEPQFLHNSIPIDVTLSGISISLSAEQSEKTLFLIVLRLVGNFTVSRAVQPMKAELPIVRSDDPFSNTTELRLRQ
jgi:hypothetical protein